MRRQVGDITVTSSTEAKHVQALIESGLDGSIGFQLKEGDLVLGRFSEADNLINRFSNNDSGIPVGRSRPKSVSYFSMS